METMELTVQFVRVFAAVPSACADVCVHRLLPIDPGTRSEY
jgi:hypothetical protein